MNLHVPSHSTEFLSAGYRMVNLKDSRPFDIVRYIFSLGRFLESSSDSDLSFSFLTKPRQLYILTLL